jgi:predicted nucleic acid-binding protein
MRKGFHLGGAITASGDELGKTFVDSNVLIYACDLDAGAQYRKAAGIPESLWDRNLGVLSIQVLQEFIRQRHAKDRSSPASEIRESGCGR